MNTIHEAVEQYKSRGFDPIPVYAKSKKPIGEAWPERNYATKDFPDGCNIGIKLGSPSGGLVDIDLDTFHACEAAELILPKTDMIFGRESKPRSHWFYRVTNPPRKTGFTDGMGTSIVEIRGTGHQTVAPPSIHQSGEPITWHQNGEPANIGIAELESAVREVAAVAVIAENWPVEGNRQNAALALAGGLLRAPGWDVNRIETFMDRVLTVARDGSETNKRTACIATTAEKLKRGEAVTGWPTLGEIIGKSHVDKVCEWLRIGETGTAGAGAGDDSDSWEAYDDPSRLAREFRKRRFDNCLYWWQSEFWQYTGTKWQIIPDADIKGKMWGFVKESFDKFSVTRWRATLAEHELKVNAARQAGKEEPAQPKRPPTPQVTPSRVHAAIMALQSDGLALLGSDVKQPSMIGEPGSAYIAMKNGLVEEASLLSGSPRLIPHSPLWFSPTCLPYSFDPAALCPKWLKSLDVSMEGDPERIALIQEWFGYCLTPDTSLQKFVVLEGSGANGKSVLLGGMKAILGEDNVSHVSLRQFDDQFSLYGTVGKLANLSYDMDDTDRAAEGILKEVSDGAPMNFDRKHRDAIIAIDCCITNATASYKRKGSLVFSMKDANISGCFRK